MFNEKPAVEITLLSKEEVKRKSSILKKVGLGLECDYLERTLPNFTAPSSGPFSQSYSDDVCNIRPVLKFDNIEELLKCFQSDIKDGIQIIEYGHFPNLFEKVKIYDTSYLRKTGKKYSLPSQETYPGKFVIYNFPEYDYFGQKIIKIDEKYHPVRPVQFYVDRENGALISTKALFKSPINIDSQQYNGNFKSSPLYSFLNNEFIKDLFPSEEIEYSSSEYSLPKFMTAGINQETIDEAKKSLIKRIDKLLKKNAELQAISKAMTQEFYGLKAKVQGRSYVKK